jgi:predicted Zn-dependent protease
MLVSFDTTCPHCNAELTYKNIPLGQNPMGRFTARMACKQCNHRFDTPLSLIVSKAEDPHLAGMVTEAEQLMGTGQLKEALGRANAVLHANPFHERALVVCGQVLLKAGQPMEATHCFSLASRVNPLRADIHGYLASALAASGNYFIAMLHMQQASHIQKIADDPARAPMLQLFKIVTN